MYYHASSVKGITQLTPQSSNHGIPLVYFSTKRENVLVYLSNSIEKYCVETGFSYDGKCQKWGPYGFGKDGRQRLEEYYPNALISTYKGVSGYIYSAETISDSGFSVIDETDGSEAAIESNFYGFGAVPLMISEHLLDEQDFIGKKGEHYCRIINEYGDKSLIFEKGHFHTLMLLMEKGAVI